MKHPASPLSLAFNTPRLAILTVAPPLLNDPPAPTLLNTIVKILTPTVTASLPSYFSNVHSPSQAKIWLEKITSDSELLAITAQDSHTIMGFIFIHESDNGCAQLGYLLGEEYWQQGFAKECLSGLLTHCQIFKRYRTFTAGVDKDNIASANLLVKMGFKRENDNNAGVTFFSFHVS